jgi:uncharacterized cupredoxin-like copper-binding protein
MLSCIILAVLGVGGLSACGSSGATHATGTLVKVEEKDFRVLMSRKRVPAGDVRFVVRNAGPDDHELIIVHTQQRSLPLRNDGVTVSEQKLEPQTVATLEPARQGAVREVRVRLARGRYEVFCNMAGHYMGGMRAFLVVT